MKDERRRGKYCSICRIYLRVEPNTGVVAVVVGVSDVLSTRTADRAILTHLFELVSVPTAAETTVCRPTSIS